MLHLISFNEKFVMQLYSLTYTSCVRSVYNVLFQVVFFLVLIAYSIFVLTSVGSRYPTPTTKALEIFVYIWTVGDAIEEFVASTVSFKIGILWYRFFNCNDHFVLSMFCSFERTKICCTIKNHQLLNNITSNWEKIA